MTKHTKFFSLEEANAMIPELEILLTRILKKKIAHDRMHDALFMEELIQEAAKSSTSSSLDHGAQEVDGRMLDFEEDLERIRTLGCLLRSLDSGFVEFPAERQGQTIYFCWKAGEEAIQYYRPMAAQFSERLPL